jgi:predicted glycosyltransferase
VYGTQKVFDPIREYGMSPVASAKTTFTGYLRQPEPARSTSEIRHQLNAQSQPLVVVTVGGGMDGGPMIRAYLEAVRQGQLAGVVSYVATGPQLSDVELNEIRALADELRDLTLVQFSDDLVSHISAADAVVTMGGYNAVCEAVGAGKRPIVIPRADGSDEQQTRAERFAALGLVNHLPPSEVTPERLTLAVRAELSRNTSPAPVLDFSGIDRASDVLIRALGR